MFKFLRRLSKTNKGSYNQALQALVSAANSPLLMHPSHAVDAFTFYADGFKNFRHKDEMESKSPFDVMRFENTAIFNIDGALSAHHVEGFCGESAASYEGIKSTIQGLMLDDSVDTIVARIDSGGGTASQNMDVSDYIFSQRGKGKRLIAMVDDSAYSAAFAIASAFNEIWVTRTGGVGSVGVVSMHVDQSKMNKKDGVKVDFIFAGDKKVFGNSHEELNDEARAEIQQEVDRIYKMFTSTVARNLGLSVDAVVATQAGTFHGQDAIEMGFATHMGTFDDLIENIQNKSIDKDVLSGVINKNEIEAAKENELIEAEDAKIEAEKEYKIIESEKEKARIESEKRTEEINNILSVAGFSEIEIEKLIKSDLAVEYISSIASKVTSNDLMINSIPDNQETINTSWASAFNKVNKV